ncbi:hypothetical protein ERX46_09480 [Brumimicrobium glaciale]|uniref:Outer membrane protein beta-barrel domain-containing protein n=1 Tax=Brumimicrobium glaciale TaxID=200475 RepID=A0A4Q4KQ88_9FLAO|nr:hypothetical protein [Brumimicrobium glaciale]RYM34179.1 hypothetical protein ERX46_09480 [Brumimicrobium glaciale]
MKSILFITITTLFLSTAAFSQLGLKGGFALYGNPKNASFMHAGGYLGMTYDINDRLRGELIIEGVFNKQRITYLESNTLDGTKKEDVIISSNIPVTLGIDYRFLKGKIQPYAGLNVGIISLGYKNDHSRGSNQNLTIHPKIGMNVAISESLLFDFALKSHFIIYGTNSNTSYSNVFGINIGINYLF